MLMEGGDEGLHLIQTNLEGPPPTPPHWTVPTMLAMELERDREEEKEKGGIGA